MLISKVKLKNIRCFKELTIDLMPDSNLKKWLTILGDNSVGKSTILKCLTMGLCDVSSAAALMKEDKANFVRKGEFKGVITVTLYDENKKEHHDIVTSISKEIKGVEDSPEIIRQVIKKKGLYLYQDVFVSAYGVQIGDGGGDTWESYKPLEAVYTLFNTNSELQNTESIMFKQQNIPFRKWLSKKLQEILMLEDFPEIEYDKKGMYVHGPWGRSRVSELSDGYRRLIQIVVDFYGWQIVSNRLDKKNDKIRGILIIDEVETHLHPKLQRFIVDRLKKHLPNVQFITTTHSPFVALGTSDIDDGLILELDIPNKDGLNIAHYLNVDPINYRGFSVDQILTSSAFDMEIARGGVIGDKIIRFRDLFLLNERSEAEESEYLRLKKEVDSEIPEIGEKEEDRKLQRDIIEMLEKINDEINDSAK